MENMKICTVAAVRMRFWQKVDYVASLWRDQVYVSDEKGTVFRNVIETQNGALCSMFKAFTSYLHCLTLEFDIFSHICIVTERYILWYIHMV